MRIYAAHLNKNRALQKINREKCINFADFWRSKCIIIQPVVKRSVGLADFRHYDIKCTQLIVKKEKKSFLLKIINLATSQGGENFFYC